MFELFALAIYSVQWLGVVIGVGAEVVLLIAHLIALHDRKPNWMDGIPAIRTAQFAGLVLIVLSGAAAVAFHVAIGQQQLILLPVFGFKWALIIALAVAYALERTLSKGRAMLEGFAGATWLALFLVHSLAPQTDWTTLAVFYSLWLAFFAVIWAAAVLAMKHAAPSAFSAPVQKQPVAVPMPVAQKPVVSAPAVAPQPKVVPPAPSMPNHPHVVPVLAVQKPAVPKVPVPAPAPVHVLPKPAPVISKSAPIVPHTPVAPIKVEKPKPEEPVKIIEAGPSLWSRFLALFARKAKINPTTPLTEPAPAEKPKEMPKLQVPVPPVQRPVPVMAAVSAPLPKIATPPPTPLAQKPALQKTELVAPAHDPSLLPVVEHLELSAPHHAPIAVKVPESAYVPDWTHLPGLRIMPQKIEDLHLHNRAPLIQVS